MKSTSRRADIAVELADRLAAGSLDNTQLKDFIEKYAKAAEREAHMSGNSHSDNSPFGDSRLQIMGALSSSNDGYPRGLAASIVATMNTRNPIEQIVIVRDFQGVPFGISIAPWEENSPARIAKGLSAGQAVIGVDARADMTSLFVELSQAGDWGSRDILVQLDTGAGIAFKTSTPTTDNPELERSKFIQGFIDGLRAISARE